MIASDSPTVLIPGYLLEDSEPVEEDPEVLQEDNLEDNLIDKVLLSPEENQEDEVNTYDYSTYLQSIIDNQESLILNQEIIITDLSDIKSDQHNFFSAITSILVLSAIVFSGFWLVKNIFFKTF